MRYAKIISVCFLLSSFLSGAAGAATLSAPMPLPGMTDVFAATGKQEKPQIARGSEMSLAVWSDTRTALRLTVQLRSVAVGLISALASGP